MATPPTETLAVTCPKCGARFRLAGEMAGRKGRCAKCGDVFRVPASAESGQPKKVLPTPKPPAPKPIAVHCRVCQTLMYGRADQVGQAIKCPDCGAQNVVPPPPVEKAKKQPKAIEGDQYEVWGVDEAPPLADIIAAQPKYIAVSCRMCQTLMHATPEQVGRRLKCPDCGSLTVVEAPHETAAKPAAANDEYELEIDPTFDPGDRPQVIVPPRRPMLYEEEAEAARKKQEERHARGNFRGPQYDDQGRAVMPRWPLATRIFPFLISSGVPVRWVLLSCGAIVFGWPMLQGISMAAMGGYGAVGGMSFMAMGLIVLAIWLAAFSAIVMTIIVESSEGNDEVQHWPGPTMGDWIGELFYMIVACLVSPLPGWLLGRMVPEPATQMLLFFGSVLICFPIAVLSQLDVGSAFAVASPRVISSFLRVPGSWLMFYVEIALLGLACLGLMYAADVVSGYLLILLPPIFVAAVLLAARILGRLAWKLAESTPGREEEPAA